MDNITLYIIIVFGTVVFFQLLYWAVFMFRIRRPKHQVSNYTRHGVSVIVCARNEAENLKELVPLLMEQDYDKYEVIIVDDRSEDDSAIVLAELKLKYNELYYTQIPGDRNYDHGKRLALTVGIKAAKYEHMLFTDADCRPTGKSWIASMVQNYTTDEKQMVLGYGRYAKEKGLLNLIIRFETFFNCVQYMGFAKSMKPFMGVGRNLSYTKSLYERSSKFTNNYGLMSGDDDLFVSEMGKRKNTDICYIYNGQTVSEPKHTWSAWAQQKSRHVTTSVHYNFGIKALLTLEIVTRQILLLGGLAMIMFGNELLQIVAAGALALRYVIMYVSLGIAQYRMGEKGLAIWAPLADIFIPYLQCVATLQGYLTKSRNRWK